MGTDVIATTPSGVSGAPAGWGLPVRPTFNLLDEPWVPVVMLDGMRSSLGLRAVMRRSRAIGRISGESGLIDTALIRLLVAMVHHVQQGPNSIVSWNALWEAESLGGETTESYLADHQDDFFLIDHDRAFAQTSLARLIQDGRGHFKSFAELQHLRATRTGKRLFDKSLDANTPTLALAEAARWLVAFQCWAPSGGAGYGSSRMVGRALTCFPMGATLHETVLLNTTEYAPAKDVPFAIANGDSPSWIRDRSLDVISADRPLDGLVDLLTRRPRAACLLLNDVGQAGLVCIAAGERIGANTDVRDPNMLYRPSKNGVYPVALPRGAPVWTELPAVLAARSEAGGRDHCAVLRWGALTDAWSAHKRLSLRIVALDSAQASVKLVADAEISVPRRVADDARRRRAIEALVAAADQGAKAMAAYVKALGRKGPISPGRKKDSKAHSHQRKAALERGLGAYWSRASVTLTASVGFVAADHISRADAEGIRERFSTDIRQAISAAIDAMDPLAGSGAAALIDAGAARALLDKTLVQALAKALDPADLEEAA